MEDFDAFARLVTALRPWLGQLVVVGGWAHRLHRFHRLAEVPGGKTDATMTKAGIRAQKLPYLDILLVSPWNVRVPLEKHATRGEDVDLFVPNPTSFIVQKLLIHADRRPHKRAQDILYIHDTLELFGGSLAELQRLWVEDVQPTMAQRTAKRVERTAKDLSAQVTDTIREAVRIPQDRRVAPENAQRALAYGLDEILKTA